MKGILIINNRSPSTGIGNYALNLFNHLKQNSKRDIDFITLRSVAEDSHGRSVAIFSQKTKRILDHFRFIRGIPNHYRVYHLVNPNLGILLSKYRPSVVTVPDIAEGFVPMVRRDVITQSYGLDAAIVAAMQVNMRFVRSADIILSMSQHTKKDLVSILGIDPRRIRVAYPGIDPSAFRPREREKTRNDLNLPLDKKIILHVGVDVPRKNIQTLLKAFYLVRKRLPNVLLIRIGGMRGHTRRLIASLGLQEQVLHLPAVPNVAPYYNAADVFVLPSYYEGFGYPVVEAMASGCPVVAGNCTSIPELVENSGMLLPPSSAAKFGEAILQVLTDRNMQGSMIQRGLKQSLKFDWSTCARQTLDAYEALYS